MSEPILDLATLLAPIDGTPGGAGTDPRRPAAGYRPYDQIKDARRDGRAAEREYDAWLARDAEERLQGEVPPADPDRHWRVIREAAPPLLAGEAKDIEIACLLGEALLRRHGLAGLAATLDLIGGLVDGYWGYLFPRPGEAEGEGEGEAAEPVPACLKPLVDLATDTQAAALVAPILKLPITDSGPPGPFAVWQLEKHRADIESSARRTPIAFYRTLAGAAFDCRAAFRRLTASLAGRLGEAAPLGLDGLDGALARLEQALALIGEAVPEVAVLLTPPPPVTAEEGEEGAGAAALVAAGLPSAEAAFASREEAFRLLERIALFFRQTEPHSPISYTLDEVVRRGRLSFPELLAELVPNEDARFLAMIRAGIRPGQGGS